jgi:hypothetical protein
VKALDTGCSNAVLFHHHSSFWIYITYFSQRDWNRKSRLYMHGACRHKPCLLDRQQKRGNSVFGCAMAQVLSPASHRRGPSQSMWDLWWTKWQCGRSLHEFFSFLLSISFYRGSPYSHIIWGMNSRLNGDRSSETESHPMNMNLCSQGAV